jgi:hypothetical protein
MSINISYTALAVALVAGSTAANAQTVITREISNQPVETVITQQPVQTVQTTETVRTVRTAVRPVVRRRVVTTERTIISQRVVPTRTIAANPQPLYDAAAPAPVVTGPAPLYDTAAPAPVFDETDGTPPAVATMIPTYRYVYEPDRILVIDPATNIAIQAIPR